MRPMRYCIRRPIRLSNCPAMVSHFDDSIPFEMMLCRCMFKNRARMWGSVRNGWW